LGRTSLRVVRYRRYLTIRPRFFGVGGLFFQIFLKV